MVALSEGDRRIRLVLLCVSMFCSGCTGVSMGSFNYGVEVQNEGHAPIRVERFNLVAKDSGTWVGVGNVLAGGRASMAPYRSRPDRSILIKWRAIDSEQGGQCVTRIAMPREFTRRDGRIICFHIDPERQLVRVTYVIFDEEKNDFREVEESR